jgi:phytoene dehydrogenase-like protein
VQVTLFEKNSEVGGRCQSMQSTKVKGYRHLVWGNNWM